MSLEGVTCIIPVWNCENYIREALDSINSQTYPCSSVIVVDDGSTDQTNQLVCRYKNVRYVRQANAGPAAARNRGMSLVNTEFVAFLDADDLWHPQKLEIQMACFQKSPELQLCVTHIENFWSPELPQESRVESEGLMRPWIGHICTALLARSSVFDRIGLLNPEMRVGEDSDWFVRAAQAGLSTEIVPQTLAYRRLHPGNLSRRDPELTRAALLRSVKQLLDWKRSH